MAASGVEISSVSRRESWETSLHQVGVVRDFVDHLDHLAAGARARIDTSAGTEGGNRSAILAETRLDAVASQPCER
jgi:hypothetical protein